MGKFNLMEAVKAVNAIDYTAEQRNLEIDSVEFDSRKIQPGSLFIPLTGGATDGHQYIEQAIENGAVASLWSRSASEAPSDRIAIIFVDDTLLAFQKLAQFYRQRLNPIVIGITGSNGKTTTKDMTANALTAKYHVHKTQGNYNNELGLPYTLLQMPAQTQVVVLEMGMSDFGDIELLTQIAEPDIAAITLIGESHLEFLGSRQGIAQAKMEILQGLKKDGLFIYPGNERLITNQLSTIRADIRQLSFGLDADFDAYAYDLIEEQDRTFFHTNLDTNVLCMIPVMGAYNVSNALIALTIAQSLSVPIEQAIFQLAQFQLTANRLEWIEGENGIQVLNDAYNASPTSMKAVLKAFASLPHHEGRKIAVLGEIRELGPDSPRYHRELQDYIHAEDFAAVYLFGTDMEPLYQALSHKFAADQLFYEKSDHQSLIENLKQALKPNDQVLIKSSLGVDLLLVVTALTGQPTHNFLRDKP